MDFLFHLDRGDKRGLKKQLRDRISASILDSKIAPNCPMPSSRRLAEQLGVGRNTVMMAYADLQDEGFLVSRERSGYFVNPDLEHFKTPLNSGLVSRKSPKTSTFDWLDKITHTKCVRRNLVKPDNWRDYKYCFVYGQLDPKLFPVRHWRECWKDAVGVQEISDWSQDRVDRDDPLLVENIKSRLLTRRGLWVDEPQILVTVGAQNALYISLNLLLSSNRTFGMEEPGYPDVRNIAYEFTSKVSPLMIDRHGLILTDDLNACDVVYVTPSHQSPTTVTMPLNRRKELLDRAEEHDFVLLEDDYEAETSFSEAPLPALKTYDKNERVIYIGSLSKTLAPGLRLGYVVAPEPFIREARALRRLIMRHPAANNQRAAAYFLERGYHESLLRSLVKTNQEKWELMSDILKTSFPEFSVSPNKGGSSFWVTGPSQLDAHKLVKDCMQDGVLIETGDAHFFKKQEILNHFRLGYTSIPLDRIEKGMEFLSKHVRKQLRTG